MFNSYVRDFKFPKIADFGDIFNDAVDFLAHSFEGTTGQIALTYHIENGEKESKIYFLVPGIKKNEIKISISGNLLNVEYAKKKFYETKATETAKISFKIGSQVDVENIQSKLEDGVLVVSIDKTLDKKEPSKTIEIK